MRAPAAYDRSWAAGASAPHGWGPGPWEYDTPESSWMERANQFGNIRAWTPDEPCEGGRVVSVEFDAHYALADRVPVRRTPKTDRVLSTCWCGAMHTEVPTGWVREGRTRSCDVDCHRRWERKQEHRKMMKELLK